MKLGSRIATMFAATAMAVTAALPAAAADGKVDFFDITKENANFVEVAPVAASTNEKISIIVHSYDRGILEAVFKTAQEIETNFDKDVVMLQAPPTGDDPNMVRIGYFYDGAETGFSSVSVNTANAPLKEQIFAAVQDGLSENTASLDLDQIN